MADPLMKINLVLFSFFFSVFSLTDIFPQILISSHGSELITLTLSSVKKQYITSKKLLLYSKSFWLASGQYKANQLTCPWELVNKWISTCSHLYWLLLMSLDNALPGNTLPSVLVTDMNFRKKVVTEDMSGDSQFWTLSRNIHPRYLACVLYDRGAELD